MRILLLTRCGAQQWREIPDKTPPWTYRIPLLRSISIHASAQDLDRALTDPVELRVFEYRDHSKYGNFAVYEERI